MQCVRVRDRFQNGIVKCNSCAESYYYLLQQVNVINVNEEKERKISPI